jgi:hypothetical protein
MMKFGAAFVCIAVLYGVDALMFDGWYVAGLTRMLSEIYVHWR